MKWTVRTLGDLGRDVVLAPERHVVTGSAVAGTPLLELVVERNERVEVDALGGAVVLDTTHAREGVLDVTSALRDVTNARSAKKRAHVGDVLVSRLRPYLRQVAHVHAAALAACGRRDEDVAVSTEFYVLAPRAPGDRLAWLLPWLLSPPVQEALASAQEGGHHPRVPRSSLLALRVPPEVIARRARATRTVEDALVAYYDVGARLRSALGGEVERARLTSRRAAGRGAPSRGTRD